MGIFYRAERDAPHFVWSPLGDSAAGSPDLSSDRSGLPVTGDPEAK